MKKWPHPVFGWNAVKLSALSFEALNELRLAVEKDGLNPAHTAGRSLYLHTKSARVKLDAIARAVTYKLAEARAV